MTTIRTRREPPRFRTLEVHHTTTLTPRLVRVTLAGDELAGMTVDLPAASVRALLPSPGTSELVMPTWNGNEFLLPDGTRPTIRTLTPRRLDAHAHELDVDVVLHGGGALGEWVRSAEPGAAVAISGPGRGYEIDPDAAGFLLAGDETALPAIAQLLEHLPPSVPVRVVAEVADPSARLELPGSPEVTWCDLPPGASPGEALVPAVAAATADLAPDTKVWVAGEAAAVQRIRKLLFQDRGIPRSQAAIRGYWKRGAAEGE